MCAELIAFAKVKFQVNEEGQVIDAQVFESSNDDHVDQLILDAMCHMPTWSPARNADDKAITQEFEFTLGTDLLRCDYVH